MEFSHGWLGQVAPPKGFLSAGHPSPALGFILLHENEGVLVLFHLLKDNCQAEELGEV